MPERISDQLKRLASEAFRDWAPDQPLTLGREPREHNWPAFKNGIFTAATIAPYYDAGREHREAFLDLIVLLVNNRDNIAALIDAAEDLTRAWNAEGDGEGPGDWIDVCEVALHKALDAFRRPNPPPFLPEPVTGDAIFRNDEACGGVHLPTGATCTLPKGHAGPHGNPSGTWR